MKLYGSYFMPFGTEIGAFFLAQSGIPVSTTVQDVNHIPLFVNGRGDLGRSPVYSRTDLLLAHEVKFGETKRLRFEFNAQNLFNQKTAEYIYNYYNRFRTAGSLINLRNVNLFNGYDWQSPLNGTRSIGHSGSPGCSEVHGAKDPRFGKEDNFRDGFIGRIGVKFTF